MYTPESLFSNTVECKKRNVYTRRSFIFYDNLFTFSSSIISLCAWCKFFISSFSLSSAIPRTRHRCGEWRKWFYGSANFNLVWWGDRKIFWSECLTSSRENIHEDHKEERLLLLDLNYYEKNSVSFVRNEYLWDI